MLETHLEIVATLEAHYSTADKYGNCYWALRFIDHKTGKQVEGTVSGGESNINSILYHWNNPNSWDRSIRFTVVEHKIREFNRLTKDWPYAGCSSEDLAAFVRKQLEQNGNETQTV